MADLIVFLSGNNRGHFKAEINQRRLGRLWVFIFQPLLLVLLFHFVQYSDSKKWVKHPEEWVASKKKEKHDFHVFVLSPQFVEPKIFGSNLLIFKCFAAFLLIFSFDLLQSRAGSLSWMNEFLAFQLDFKFTGKSFGWSLTSNVASNLFQLLLHKKF